VVFEVVAGLWLAKQGTRVGLWLAATCLGTFVAYAMLEIDLRLGTDVIYTHYEWVIYGLIASRVALICGGVGARNLDFVKLLAPGRKGRFGVH